MRIEAALDRWGQGWRGPAAAAALALLAGLPGALALPPLDRDESRFAEASAQMLESRDFVSIHFQDQPRFKKPIGIYWLQAAAVAATDQLEARRIWAWRIPSLAGAMLAAAACVWAAGAFLPPAPRLLAGVVLAASFMLSTEADIAATDAVLAGAVTLAMGALLRLYAESRGGPAAGVAARALFWAGLALSILVKGPIGPMVVGLTLVALAIWDRRAGWMARLGWGWGLIYLGAALLPWAMAITVATDGAFWGGAVGGDLGPKLVEGQEGHGAPPGWYLAFLPLLIFPAGLLLPAATVTAWRDRAQPAIRFSLCWLIPAWLVFELVPTKLVHYTLPLYGALALLTAAALAGPLGRWTRIVGAVLIGLTALVFAALAPAAAIALHVVEARAWLWMIPASALFLAAAGLGVGLIAARPAAATLLAALAAAAGHAVLLGAVAPALAPLWLSSRAAGALSAAGQNPREGVVQGPVAVAGYAEPSLVFLLGADTRLGEGSDAADAIADGRPAIVEARQQAPFDAALKARGVIARQVGQVEGLDYSKGRHDILRLYRPAAGAASETP
jgi:4-amino-4-deoxy-L-arabinose transferase-like glycosyltransferase